MSGTIQFRHTEGKDTASILAIYPQAFEEEDLVPLTQELLDLDEGIISLGAFNGEHALAHVVFTKFKTHQNLEKPNAALLGPLCVLPKHHNQGIGRTLVKHGFKLMLSHHIDYVFVLGDPAYYSRLDFTPERDFQPPFPLPKEWADAWQSQTLSNASPLGKGTCHLPDVWMDKALWLP